MHKTAFTILFLIFNVCSLAQEKQFEYTDSTLLMETQTLEEPNSDVDENDIDNNDFKTLQEIIRKRSRDQR